MWTFLDLSNSLKFPKNKVWDHSEERSSNQNL
jgi:hypothetical protein